MFLNKFQRYTPADTMLQFRAALEKMSASKSLDALLETAFREALVLAQADVGSLFMVDEKKEEFVLKEAAGQYLSQFPQIRRSLKEGILGYVASQRAPLLVENTRRHPHFRNGNGFSGYRTTSFISIPLILNRRLIGILNLTDKKSKRPFSKEDLEWLTLYVDCFSLCIEKHRLAAEVKTRREAFEETHIMNLFLQQERRRLQGELELSQKMASIGKLAAGIAHELNNPLDGTLRYIHLSLNHLREGDTVREYLLEVKQGLDRMANIVKNLLAFSRRQRAALKPVDVNEILDTVLSNVPDASYPSRVEIVKTYHPALPLLLDKGIDQIFTNIIKNALEAMPHGGTLRLTTLKNDYEIIVRISDTGCGIAEENKSYIFEPFFTTKEIDKGCGLGLAICYEIVQAYEGKIEVESEKGRGATFLIHFPLRHTVSKEASLSYAR